MNAQAQDAMVQMEARQNALLTAVLKAFRTGQWTGAQGLDGLYVALTGQPLDYVGTWPVDQPDMFIGQGIDISDYQPTVDWNAVKAAGIKFVWTKATEGVGFKCDTFDDHWQGIASVGLGRGAYHFARPDLSDPISEAKYFLSVVTLGPNDKIALDIEKGSGDLSNWVLQWLEYVKNATGKTPYLYSGMWFMEPNNLLVPALAEYPLWLAAYQSTQPVPPSPWTKIEIWQYSDKGNVPGVGKVDLDLGG